MVYGNYHSYYRLDSSSEINHVKRKLHGEHYGVPGNTLMLYFMETMPFKMT